MRTKLLAALTAALTMSLAGAAGASATTFHASPSSARTQAPCTAESPCKLSFALGQTFSGDDVALAPGTYDHFANDPLKATATGTDKTAAITLKLPARKR